MICVSIKSSTNKYLFIQRSSKISYPNAWVCPGGKLDPNESLEQGAYREVFEETGIKLDPSNVPLKPYFLYEAFSGPKDGSYGHYIIVYYFAETGLHEEQFEVKLQVEEVQDYRWVDEKDLRGYLKETSELGPGEGEGRGKPLPN